jgi:histidyl-tRNA synthetase
VGLRVRPDGSGRKLGKQLESAVKAGAAWAVILGDELSRGEVVLRDLLHGEQGALPLDDVPAAIHPAH